jgi:beta-barrel assembly-enhancing protease
VKFLNKKLKYWVLCAFVLAGCSTLEKAAVYVGEVTGNDTLVKAAGDMTPQQEYFLGRSITAKIVSDKKLVDNKKVQAYINYIGQYLAYHSDRPDLFVGYRFAVLDDTTLSAISTPGGFILISKSMVTLTQNEDELAAVLAHEIGHISQKHAEKNIKNSNQLSIGKSLVSSIAKKPGQQDLTVFSEAIASGLDTSYNKDQEMEADQEAIRILKKAGYAPAALKSVLSRMPENTDLMSKHPRSAARLEKLDELVGQSLLVESPARQKRFLAYTVF